MTKPEEPSRRFLTIEQVAEELSVRQSLVRALLRNGELRGMQVGSRGIWRISTADIEDYVNQAYKTTADRVAAGEIADGTTDDDEAQLGET